MPNNLGRDEVWSQEVWQEIDNAVLAEVGRIRVAQKVFPSSPSPNGQYVPADEFDPNTMTIAEGQTKPFIEISVEFRLTQGQVDNEATLRTGRTLARLAAKSATLAEDTLFFQGKGAKLPTELENLRKKNLLKIANKDAAGPGLLNAKGNNPIPVSPVNPNKPGEYGGNTFKAVTQGISQLTDAAQPGPYALILESAVYADTYAPVQNGLTTTADRLTPLLPGGFYGTGTLPNSSGLLVSLGGEPTSLYVGRDAITAYTQEVGDGNSRFRVFERVQLIARDPKAFVNLDFQ
jgi:uncharacterized linocin/CFP29 family protein